MEEKYSSDISAGFAIEIKRKKERFAVRSFLHIGLPYPPIPRSLGACSSL